MPTQTSLIPEITTHILKPVCEQVIRKLILDIGCEQIFKNNIFIKDALEANNSRLNEHHAPQLTTNFFECNLNYTLNPKMVKWNDAYTFTHTSSYGLTINKNYHGIPIFHDRDSKIFVYEHYAPASITMDCKINFIDSEMAYVTYMALQNLYIDESIMFHEDLLFNYPLPKGTLSLLYSLFKYKKFDEPVNFITYLKAGSTNYDTKQSLISVDVTRTGKNKELVVNKTHIWAHGAIESSNEKPSEVKTNLLTTSNTLEFTYTLQFLLPNTLTISYPIIVDNELISEQMIPINRTNNVVKIQNSDYAKALDINYNKFVNRHLPILRLPFYDDFTIPMNFPLYRFGYEPFIIGAFTLDTDQEFTVLDFSKDLGGFVLNKFVQNILFKTKGSFLYYKYLYTVTLYADHNQIEPNILKIDNENPLKIFCPNKNIKKIYHFIISEHIALRLWYILHGMYPDYDNPNFDFDKPLHEWPAYNSDNTIKTDELPLIGTVPKGTNYGYSIPQRVLHADLIARKRNIFSKSS